MGDTRGASRRVTRAPTRRPGVVARRLWGRIEMTASLQFALPAPPDRTRRIVARSLAIALAGWLAGPSFPPGGPAASPAWSKNLWTSGSFLYQDPYFTACTAASTM